MSLPLAANDLINTPNMRTHLGASRGHGYIRKFGYNPDVDAAEDLWDQGGTYTFLSSATTLYISSSHASDTFNVVVEGLDSDWNHNHETVTLNGQTQVAIDNTWIRIFRAHNDSGTAAQGDIYIAEEATGGDLSGGVPQTASKIKAKITIGNEQTHMSIWTCPVGMTGFIMNWTIEASGLGSGWLTGPEGMDAAILTREFGKVFRVQERIGLINRGSSMYEEEFHFFIEVHQKADVKIRIMGTTANNAQVSGTFEILTLDSVETGS